MLLLLQNNIPAASLWCKVGETVLLQTSAFFQGFFWFVFLLQLAMSCSIQNISVKICALTLHEYNLTYLNKLIDLRCSGLYLLTHYTNIRYHSESNMSTSVLLPLCFVGGFLVA